uniref:C1q domain-containing protein n=1 Tax=Sinocyclocheilus rhinocerous TaxID=307959 RepID=A0A673LTD0_9TELE
HMVEFLTLLDKTVCLAEMEGTRRESQVCVCVCVCERERVMNKVRESEVIICNLIYNVLVPKVAFSASLLTSFRPQSIGPFRNGLHTLIYRYVFLNTGNAYDPNTVIFTAPVRGAYAFRVFSKAFGSLERAVTAGLFKNDQHIISTHGHQASGFISSSNGVYLVLEGGDKVKVNLYPGQWIFDNGEHHHSTFSGHLFLM